MNKKTEMSSEFHKLSPTMEGSSTTEDLSQGSIKSAEEDLEEIKEEFQKLEKPPFKVRTFAVNRDGDLISEHSDSDKSHSSGNNGVRDLTNYTMSTRDSTGRFISTEDSNALSMYTLPEKSAELSMYTLPDKSAESRLSEFTNRSSGKSDSQSSDPKSSSFTNVTSDPSLNITGSNSILSQHTLNDTKGDNNTSNAIGGVNEQDNLENKFASLDNLISESKQLIARHKDIIGKTKPISSEVPELPKQPPPPLIKTRETTPTPPAVEPYGECQLIITIRYITLTQLFYNGS